ncbi:MAG: delta-aminolevulinic acid dehydratase [Coxiella sp. RIFCSPHIGHO2_12_FULL_44_14]|nr:MAG: delta-aminolevulinic acid dehydratase [Coxiella sp. RIFCSPHIGHO2_12_FULL_44_14]
MTTLLETKTSGFPNVRMRRLRYHPQLRQMISEHRLHVSDFVLPLFIYEGEGVRNPIRSMPGHFQISLDQLEQELLEIKRLHIRAVILFGIPKQKDDTGSHALTTDSVIAQAIRKIKQHLPDLIVISDVCFCEYTSHGHCGVLYQRASQTLDVHNDETLALLAKQAVVHAKAGADIIAPSGMMDGMVAAIRIGLDTAGFNEIPILSYAIKFASSFYGPFREAAEGAPQFGDRKTYQMDPANALQSLREAALDVMEGADMLMVKPAQSYLDIIYRVKQQFPGLPLVAYQVSGEFAMLKAAAQNGWLDETTAMLESLIAIKRAGADIIITYFAKTVAEYLLA